MLSVMIVVLVVIGIGALVIKVYMNKISSDITLDYMARISKVRQEELNDIKESYEKDIDALKKIHGVK